MKQYREELNRRDSIEEKAAYFMDRDHISKAADTDPHQMAAVKCSVLGELVAAKLSKFRRPQESLLDTSSILPFMHKEQSDDLSELSNVLTLDLERREQPFKESTKRPGFMSLQLCSRMPLTVSDPVAGLKLDSEKLVNDVHAIRLDLQPGEVRHVAYALDNSDFRKTKLASRMSAVIDPENSVLARLVKTFKSQEVEVKALNMVLSDILRDLPDDLPPASEPDIEAAGQEAKAKRLEAIADGSRKILARVLESMEVLASLATPLIPSLAHALDRVALICVREVDRLIMKCHRDYESLFKLWTKTEYERRELVGTIDRMGGKADGSGGVELRQRVSKLHSELVQQEKLYASLLAESQEQESVNIESQRTIERLRNMNKELRREVAELKRRRRSGRFVSSDSAATLEEEDATTSPAKSQSLEFDLEDGEIKSPEATPRTTEKISTPQNSASSNERRLTRTFSKGQDPSPPRTPNIGLKKFRDGLLSFTVPASTQTDTEHFFNDHAELAEEKTHSEYGEVMNTANRLFRILCKYEWNSVASIYFLKPGDDESQDAHHITPHESQHAESARVGKMLNLQSLKMKVERSHIRAHISQLDEEIHRLQACVKEGFESWMAGSLRSLGSVVKGATEEPLRADDVWKELVKYVHAEGLRQRVRELEDHLSSLLPLAERARPEEGGEGNSDFAFWKRVLRQVRQNTSLQRKGSGGLGKIYPLSPSSPSSENGRRSSLGNMNYLSAHMESSKLLSEVAAIWASLIAHGDSDEPKSISGRVPAQQVFKACIKTFYLRKSGRAKHVESAVVALCTAVAENIHVSPKLCLFSIMSDIASPASLEGKLPVPIRETQLTMDPKILTDFPLDGAHVMAHLQRELKGARRSKKHLVTDYGRDIDSDAADPILPIQLILTASKTCIADRCQHSAKFFNLLMLGFAEFNPSLDYKVLLQMNDESEEVVETQHDLATNASTENIPRGRRLSNKMIDERILIDDNALQELLFVSHLMHAHVWHQVALNSAAGILSTAETDEEKEAEVLNMLWMRLLEEACSVSRIRKSLGLSQSRTCNGEKVGECLVNWGVVLLPISVVCRAVTTVSGMVGVSPSEVKIDKDQFMRLGSACHKAGNDGGVFARESIALWAGCWSIGYERSHEIAQMGELFEMYDTSGDGELQFEEFAEFIQSVAPGVSRSDAEELFLCGAEEVEGDMTKDVFLHLVLRLGITSDIDMLDNIVATKKATTVVRFSSQALSDEAQAEEREEPELDYRIDRARASIYYPQ
eukprot:CAMPEP_0169194860 /NCGR_PEP_ID=MMETSP1016-20121227/6912_1 /TAXON_ID=342587 /ORGANISM="Karlodinium micrum, Strain CCMP2283" /LENGTH=1265 /DNA_ID=CAMNT_0009271373 /DNA_START=307 /DNA_END=4104 /DNA_ORIENTATION=+